ncbi:DUF3443 domain-containing protein [Trinickia symbiotica]|uniref:DUF3443 domain-containing protein n=1 Tax=Trinickia symbiotica TaxID=863227 RepID=UPI002158B0C4|nr:DUF3443 domain-containing protein [Trinickia symbiotica]
MSNQVTVTVAKSTVTSTRTPNIPTVSVTVCAPGTSTCQTIDNIQVDTMSYGLRLVNTAASTVLGSLSAETDSSGNTIAECTVFADGYTWGSVRKADVKIAGETASNIPIGILGDMDSTISAPSSCSSQSTGSSENTASAIGANGILGIGVAPYDCPSCVSTANNGTYYSCGSSTCSQTAMALTSQVANPVAKFTSDNNGIVLTMPSIDTSGVVSATGTLTFGIGTQSNNTYSASQKFGTDSAGNVNSTVLSSTSASTFGFFDSGSNGYFFDDSTLAQCSGGSWYCPTSTTTRSVTVSNKSGSTASATVTMTIAKESALSTSNYAFNDLAGTLGLSNVMDFGLPFFYGKTVYFGYDTATAGTGSQSPFVAY